MKLRAARPRWQAKAHKPTSKNSRVKIEGRHDLEEFSLALQVLIARLQDMGVSGVQNVSLYFEPLDCHGLRTMLLDEHGKPAEALTVSRPRG
jgi:hypothetical protein